MEFSMIEADADAPTPTVKWALGSGYDNARAGRTFYEVRTRPQLTLPFAARTAGVRPQQGLGAASNHLER